MCLFVDKKYRKTAVNDSGYVEYSMPEPLVAEEDIHIFKVLHVRPNARVETPYTLYPVKFDKKNRCILEAELNPQWFARGVTVVREGIHGYVNRFAADKEALILNRGTSMTCPTSVYQAIIPRGTKYYIGDNEDIVAEKMVIIKNI